MHLETHMPFIARFIAGLVAGAALLPFALAGGAAAKAPCAIAEAAGKPAPAPLAKAPGKGFRIFWHISTQIEDLADAGSDPQALADIRQTQNLTDGYFINVLINGPGIYWPGRPKECVLNFMRIGAGDKLDVLGDTLEFDERGKAVRQRCKQEQEKFLGQSGYAADDSQGLQFDALRKTAANLDLRTEAGRGKDITAVLVLSTADMDYREASDTVKLKKLPNAICSLNSLGITPNGLMVYQEPSVQLNNGTFLWVSRPQPSGKLARSAEPRADKIPDNSRVFKLVHQAFAADTVPVGGMYPNLRVWNRRTPELARRLAAMPEIAGFNFEGGPGLMALQARKIGNYATGIAWILANTGKNASLLMPGYWDRNDIGSLDEIDTLIGRLRAFILQMNQDISAAMGLPKGQNGICNNRIILIPGSYGRPLHVKTLPSERNGHLAGTVTGEIRLLAQMRKELCGV